MNTLSIFTAMIILLTSQVEAYEAVIDLRPNPCGKKKEAGASVIDLRPNDSRKGKTAISGKPVFDTVYLPEDIKKEDNIAIKPLTGLENYPNMQIADMERIMRIRQVLHAWKIAWEGEELGSYMSCYSESASIERVTVNKEGNEVARNLLSKGLLRQRMKKLFLRYEWIEIRIAEPKLSMNGRSFTANLKFMQTYEASGKDTYYTDYGEKHIRMEEIEGKWRIVYETFKTLYKRLVIAKRQ